MKESRHSRSGTPRLVAAHIRPWYLLAERKDQVKSRKATFAVVESQNAEALFKCNLVTAGRRSDGVVSVISQKLHTDFAHVKLVERAQVNLSLLQPFQIHSELRLTGGLEQIKGQPAAAAQFCVPQPFGSRLCHTRSTQHAPFSRPNFTSV